MINMNMLLKLSKIGSLLTLCIILFTACGEKESDQEPNTNAAFHSYEFSIVGGETFSGEVPKESGGVYNTSSILTYNEEVERNSLAITLLEAGKAQIVAGIFLDDNNQPISVEMDGEQFSSNVVFQEWGEELRYRSAQIDITLEDYQEHTISAFGEEATVASLTFNFEGIFEASTTGEEVEVSGKITIAAP